MDDDETETDQQFDPDATLTDIQWEESDDEEDTSDVEASVAVDDLADSAAQQLSRDEKKLRRMATDGWETGSYRHFLRSP